MMRGARRDVDDVVADNYQHTRGVVACGCNAPSIIAVITICLAMRRLFKNQNAAYRCCIDVAVVICQRGMV